MTAALEGGKWSAVRPGRTLPPGKTRYTFYRRLEVTGDWINLHNEQLHGWYCLLNTCTVRVAAVMHVASLERKRNAYTLLVLREGPERSRNMEDPDVDRIIILSGS